MSAFADFPIGRRFNGYYRVGKSEADFCRKCPSALQISMMIEDDIVEEYDFILELIAISSDPFFDAFRKTIWTPESGKIPKHQE